jgi:hypothetical protein
MNAEVKTGETALDRAIEKKRQDEAEVEAEKEKIIAALRAELKPLAVQAAGWLKEIESYIPTVLECVDKIERTDYVKLFHVARFANELRAAAMNNPGMIREGLKHYAQLSTKELRPGIRHLDSAAAIRADIKAQLSIARGCLGSLKAGVERLRSIVEHDEERREYERSIGMSRL